MNTITMIEAFSNLDDDLVEKHFKAKEALKAKKAKPRKPVWLKWSAAVAACLCIMLVAASIMIPTNLKENGPFNYGYTSEFRLYYEGDIITNEIGTMEYIEHKNNSITLVLDKKNNDYIFATLFGYSKKSSEERTIFCGTTSAETRKKNVNYIENGLLVYVDGELVSELPQAPGKYTITINYENLKNACEELDVGLYIHGFEYFVINPYEIEGIDPDKLIPQEKNDQGGGQTNVGGVFPEGVDPVISSLAVFPASASIYDVENATKDDISEAQAYKVEALGNYLPNELPKNYKMSNASLYETNMKDGTKYFMLRATYEAKSDADTIGNQIVVFVINYLPETDNQIYAPSDISERKLAEIGGSTFHISYDNVYVGISNSGATAKEMLTVINSINQ